MNSQLSQLGTNDEELGMNEGEREGSRLFYNTVPMNPPTPQRPLEILSPFTGTQNVLPFSGFRFLFFKGRIPKGCAWFVRSFFLVYRTRTKIDSAR